MSVIKVDNKTSEGDGIISHLSVPSNSFDYYVLTGNYSITAGDVADIAGFDYTMNHNLGFIPNVRGTVLLNGDTKTVQMPFASSSKSGSYCLLDWTVDISNITTTTVTVSVRYHSLVGFSYLMYYYPMYFKLYLSRETAVSI